ncbi:HAMP domain-containing sensor histidine kinase [Cellulomonas cellasea]|uniref:histidine kinase n=1 Tax=Cellulomonas cellasea TaxID=43670 RepID=A0A7W4UGI7_9CELL|nr:HAMP domain-containing sensor histidine kinase [Cellulomonas cellasea]MBB2923747.1 two-component system sensor histidine kinase VanS [Cellulomonas cellasea]
MTTRRSGPRDGGRAGLRTSARLRLTVSYVAFLLVAGLVMSVCIWAVLRFVPNYPLTAANPRDLGSPIASRGEILDAVVQACAIALAVLAVVGSAGGWWLAGRVLTPLQHLNAAARAAADGDLTRRVGSRGSRRDEFTDLADTFDSMLDRLERDLHAQRRFAANASHELRTPLAVMRAMVDVAREDPDDVDLPVLLQRLDETTQRATDLVTALLDLAALDQGAVAHRPVDLDVLVADAVEDLAPEARSRGVTVTTRIDRATVLGDETLLLRAVDNLLRNAVRHNRPDGGRVVVTLDGGGGDDGSGGFHAPGGAPDGSGGGGDGGARGGSRDGADRAGGGHRWSGGAGADRGRAGASAVEAAATRPVRFCVENDGAHVDARRLRLALEPLTRRVEVVGGNAGASGAGDGSTRSHGLGLPLTARIVAVHGGSLDLVPRPEGGVRATVTWRSADRGSTARGPTST